MPELSQLVHSRHMSSTGRATRQFGRWRGTRVQHQVRFTSVCRTQRGGDRLLLHCCTRNLRHSSFATVPSPRGRTQNPLPRLCNFATIHCRGERELSKVSTEVTVVERREDSETVRLVFHKSHCFKQKQCDLWKPLCYYQNLPRKISATLLGVCRKIWRTISTTLLGICRNYEKGTL
jgi:hypothetical protein